MDLQHEALSYLLEFGPLHWGDLYVRFDTDHRGDLGPALRVLQELNYMEVTPGNIAKLHGLVNYSAEVSAHSLPTGVTVIDCATCPRSTVHPKVEVRVVIPSAIIEGVTDVSLSMGRPSNAYLSHDQTGKTVFS